MLLDSLLFLSASCAVAPSTTARIRSHKSVGTLQEWALQDTAATYTVGDGERRVTFWNSLATEHPALRHADVETLSNRAALLGLTVGPEPKLLGSAQRIDDGRWSGTVDGHVRTINAASEGRLASGEEFIESLTGEIFALELTSESRAAATLVPDPPSLSACTEQWSICPTLQTAYIASLVACALMLGGQLVSLGVHASTPTSTRVEWQTRRVSEARSEVLQLEDWLNGRREAFAADQEAFARRMSELEPRLEESEARLAELVAEAR